RSSARTWTKLTRSSAAKSNQWTLRTTSMVFSLWGTSARIAGEYSSRFPKICEKTQKVCGQTAATFGYPGMGLSMTSDPSNVHDLLARARSGDEQALAELFTRYRDRLRRMVHLRLDRHLQGRIDASDVMQEAFIEFARRLPQYSAESGMPFFL